MGEKDVFALLAIDSAKATIATLKGDHIQIIKSTRSGAAKKHRKGGQSSVRYARLRVEAIARYLKRVSDEMKQYFLEDAKFELKGVIIGGIIPLGFNFIFSPFDTLNYLAFSNF